MSDPPVLTLDQARELAARHGLQSLTARPALSAYVADLWRRRAFIATLSSGQSAARYQKNQLGRLWQVFNPALLIISYFLIFGLLIGTRRGVENYIGFLSIGVILYGVSAAVVQSGSKAISGNVGLVRALRFPRAVLPISVGLTEMIAAAPAFVLLLVVMVATGERPNLEWLLFPVALVFQGLQITGLALISARVVNASTDLANLVPFFLRVLRYVSGVFFSLSAYTERAPSAIAAVMEYQPFALQLTTARQALMDQPHVELWHWVASAGWAVGLMIVGIVVFWGGESDYGRG